MATQLGIYREALRLLGEHDIASTSENVEARRVLDTAYADAIRYCLALGWWKFAMSSAQPSLSSSSVPVGYTRKFAASDLTDWMRTHSVGVISGTRFLPIDWSQQGTTFCVKYSSAVTVRYLKGGSNEINPANFPDVFAKLVAAFLAKDVRDRIRGGRQVSQSDIDKAFEERLQVALASESIPPPLPLPDHAVERISRQLLEQGFWRFSCETVAPSTTTGPAAGFAKAHTVPADSLRIYGAYIDGTDRLCPIDWTSEGGKLSTNYATDLTAPYNVATKIIHVSSDFVDPTTWPETFARAVDAALQLESARHNSAPSDKIEAAQAQLDAVVDAQLGKDRLPRPMLLGRHAIAQAARHFLETGWWDFSVKTTSLSAEGSPSPAAGYSASFVAPTDLLRIYDVAFEGSDDRLWPVDWHYSRTTNELSASTATLRVRYVSTAYLVPTTWDESFTAVIEAYLALESAKASGAGPQVEAAKVQYEQAIAASKDKDRLPAPRVLPEHAVAKAARKFLEDGWWDFSIKTASLSAEVTPSPAAGYSTSFSAPADLLRIYDVAFEGSDDRLWPVDWHYSHTTRELSSAVATLRVRFVSTAFLVQSTWTDGFAAVVDSYLTLESARTAGAEAAAIEAAKLRFEQALQQTAAGQDRLPPPRRLREHAVANTARKLLEEGWWRFAVKTAAGSSTTGAASGYSHVYTTPADCLRIYDVMMAKTVGGSSRLYPVDWHQEAGKISAQSSAVVLRYVASAYLVPTTWTQGFAHAVDAALNLEAALNAGAEAAAVEAAKAQLAKILDAALEKDGLPRPLRLPAHACERVFRAQLEEGLWKFAVKTVSITMNVASPSGGYAYRGDKPADWMRTLLVFRLVGTQECALPFRDEGVDLHADYSPIYLRYISTDGKDPASGWPETFTLAFEAGIRYEAALADQLPESAVIARRREWRELLSQAKIKDGLNERPRVSTMGLFNRARGGFVNREQGL